MLSLFVMPSPTSTLEFIGGWSLPFFDETIPIAWVIVGIMFGAMALIFFIGVVIATFDWFVHRVIRGEHTVHYLGRTSMLPYHEDAVVNRHGDVVDEWRH